MATIKKSVKTVEVSQNLMLGVLDLMSNYGYKQVLEAIKMAKPKDINKFLDVELNQPPIELPPFESDIELNYYGGENEKDRVFRLRKVVEFIEKIFITHPLSLNDHKGCLEVKWYRNPTEFQRTCIELAWSKQYEYEVSHSWMEDESENYVEQLKNPLWQKKRLAVLERDNFTCQKCGNKNKTLNVHHKEYWIGRLAYEYPDTNLVTYCEKCHKEEGESEKKNSLVLLLKELI